MAYGLPPLVRAAEGLFLRLNAAKADFTVVGGVALILWTIPTETVDIDLAVPPRGENGHRRVLHVLREIGYTPTALKAADGRFYRGGKEFRGWGDFLKMSVPLPAVEFERFVSPKQFRVDLNPVLTGVQAEEVWENRLPTRFGRARVRVISLEDIGRNKRAILADPRSTEEQKAKAGRHLLFIQEALEASRRISVPGKGRVRKFRKIQGRWRLVSVSKARGRERIRIVI